MPLCDLAKDKAPALMKLIVREMEGSDSKEPKKKSGSDVIWSN